MLIFYVPFRLVSLYSNLRVQKLLVRNLVQSQCVSESRATLIVLVDELSDVYLICAAFDLFVDDFNSDIGSEL